LWRIVPGRRGHVKPGEVVVDYMGAGFAGMSKEDGKTRFRFDAKSLR
jgi:hypothetical protein